MAAANTYGLMLIMLMLGHGLVTTPRLFFEQSNPKRMLDRKYLMAVVTDSNLYEAVWKLEEIEECVRTLVSRTQEGKHAEGVPEFIRDMKRTMDINLADAINEYGSSELDSRRTTKRARDEVSSGDKKKGSGPLITILDTKKDLTVKRLSAVNAIAHIT